MSNIDRRQFLQLAGIGGVVFASGLGFNVAASPRRNKALSSQDFHFVQLSDTHWGFDNPKVNPESASTLMKAITAVNQLEAPPDFIVFTGDLTHTTDDPAERRKRMATFKSLVAQLTVKDVKFIPGEHDASLDGGVVYREFFGDLHYSFNHKGVHFIVLDNVSDPAANLGQAQLHWLEADLRKQKKHTPIVVLTHRPLFALYPEWDWFTRDGQAALDLLMPHHHVAVFYGHIHQIHQHQTGHIKHYAAQSLIFPLPAPGSAPKRAPIPWDAAKPFQGLGFRDVATAHKAADYPVADLPLNKGEPT